MHELSVAQSIVKIVLAKAEAEHATRIVRIRIAIGTLTAYVDESIQFYWDSIAEGTLAAGATLEFVRIPGVLRCLSCNGEFSTTAIDFQCPVCGGLWTQPLAGDDCFVETIEIDCPDSVCEDLAVCR